MKRTTRTCVILLSGLLIVLALAARFFEPAPAPPPPPPAPPPYFNRDVVGVEPEGEPEFTVDVELSYSGIRPVLTFTISERHGWYAEYVYVSFSYGEPDENGDWRQLGEPVPYLCHRYLDFGATLVEQTTPVHIEFSEAPEDFGTSENWRAVVGSYRRILAPKKD